MSNIKYTFCCASAPSKFWEDETEHGQRLRLVATAEGSYELEKYTGKDAMGVERWVDATDEHGLLIQFVECAAIGLEAADAQSKALDEKIVEIRNMRTNLELEQAYSFQKFQDAKAAEAKLEAANRQQIEMHKEIKCLKARLETLTTTPSLFLLPPGPSPAVPTDITLCAVNP